MANFIESNTSYVRSSYVGVIKNVAINIEKCLTIEKDFKVPHTDGHPCVIFYFGKEDKIIWLYNTERDRDMEYEKLLKIGK